MSGDRTVRHSLEASPGILKHENGGVDCLGEALAEQTKWLFGAWSWSPH